MIEASTRPIRMASRTLLMDCGYDLRLIVERLDVDSRRQRLPNAVDLGVNFICDCDRIAVGLTVDVEQHRRLSVGGHDGVHRLHAGSNRGHIANPDGNSGWRGLDYDLRELRRIFHLAVHQREIKLMVLLHQARRINEVGPPDRVENVGDGHTCRQQLGRIGSDGRTPVPVRLAPPRWPRRRDD